MDLLGTYFVYVSLFCLTSTWDWSFLLFVYANYSSLIYLKFTFVSLFTPLILMNLRFCCLISLFAFCRIQFGIGDRDSRRCSGHLDFEFVSTIIVWFQLMRKIFLFFGSKAFNLLNRRHRVNRYIVEHWLSQGVSFRIVRPLNKLKDFNI